MQGKPLIILEVLAASWTDYYHNQQQPEGDHGQRVRLEQLERNLQTPLPIT
jgi:hypothetical protein